MKRTFSLFFKKIETWVVNDWTYCKRELEHDISLVQSMVIQVHEKFWRIRFDAKGRLDNPFGKPLLHLFILLSTTKKVMDHVLVWIQFVFNFQRFLHWEYILVPLTVATCEQFVLLLVSVEEGGIREWLVEEEVRGVSGKLSFIRDEWTWCRGCWWSLRLRWKGMWQMLWMQEGKKVYWETTPEKDSEKERGIVSWWDGEFVLGIWA